MQMDASGRGSYKTLAAGRGAATTLPCDIWWIYRPLSSSTVDMVKYFSVDWLAQSHSSGAAKEGQRAPPAHRPHVLCMVQPSTPSFGKGYLQPKPKPSKAVKQGGSDEVREPQSSRVGSPLHPAVCSSPMSGYSSGYESEAESSECPSVDEGNEAEKDAPQRRVRTKFTPEQISRLEKIFSKHKYLDAGERVKTAQKLDLTETQVRTWFQNRRMKLKREVQDYLAPQVPSVSFRPLHAVQYHPVAAHQAHYTASGRGLYPLPVPQLVMSPHPAPQLMMRHPHFY